MADVTVSIRVNGTPHTVTADAGMPLLWVLRDIIGLTGTKFGCGIEQCKACSVLVNGQLEKSCDEDLSSMAGADILTIEGLSPDRTHALQQAWIAEQVPQCGYCQSGALMAAHALLRNNPRPSDSAIDSTMSNICACGTYPRMKKAIKRAAGIA